MRRNYALYVCGALIRPQGYDKQGLLPFGLFAGVQPRAITITWPRG
jgi:hypothetical protein